MNLFLEVITPEKVAFSGEVDYLSAPAVAGTVGILPNHAPLFTQLEEGELKIEKDKKVSYFSLGGGFLEVAKNKITVLVTKAVDARELNEAKILAGQKEAREALKQKPKGEALISAQALLRSSLSDLKILRRRKLSRNIPS